MAENSPHFEGEVEARWLVDPVNDDRGMKLLSDFTFVDSSGYRWTAKRDEEVDGASIPEVVWSKIVGTPFIGDYRRASVVHDVACDRKEKTSKEAHRMFYEAMLADGTSEARALIFYTAVRLFGPKWEQGQAMFEATSVNRAIDFKKFESALDSVLG